MEQKIKELKGKFQSSLIESINQVGGLFGLEPIQSKNAEIVTATAAPFFQSGRILALMKTSEIEPKYVVGNLSMEQAYSMCYRDIGLGIFSLPCEEENNLFFYLPVLSLSQMILAIKKSQRIDRQSCAKWNEQGIEKLQWARCHEAIREIQTRFGHGQRDEMQKIQDVHHVSNVVKELIHRFSGMPCREDCHLLQELKTIENGMHNSSIPAILRRIANVDCQIYRQALTMPSVITSSYRRIYIAEDNLETLEDIKKKLNKIYSRADIKGIHIDKSLESWTLYDEDGKEIDLTEGDCQGADTLVCLDMSISQNTEQTYGLHGGLWFLYKIALQSPFVSRMVITGFRSQNQICFNAGTEAFLLKPFDQSELEKALAVTKPFNIIWICPPDVQRDWYAPHQQNITWVQTCLDNVLGKYGIRLEIKEKIPHQAIVHNNIIILDYLPLHEKNEQSRNEQQERLITDYLMLCSIHPQANILILLPMEDAIFQANGLLYSLGKVLRDGRDKIIHKPIWLYSQSSELPSLDSHVMSMLRGRPQFDAKYVVITPLMGLIWPKAQPFWQNLSLISDTVIAWAPLGILMAEFLGFSSVFKDIVVNPYLKDILTKKLDEERVRNEKRWKTISTPSSDIVCKFFDYLCVSGNPIVNYGSLECWIRYVLYRYILEAPGGASLPHPLTRIFGGETRYEFGIRGGWYDGTGKFVADIPLVIEFCARKGIFAREMIERVIGNYLKFKGGEQAMLFQEVPIAGFLSF